MEILFVFVAASANSRLHAHQREPSRSDCEHQFVAPSQAYDLLILEFVLNDNLHNGLFEKQSPMLHPARKAYERLIRKSLTVPGAPALVAMHAYSIFLSNYTYYDYPDQEMGLISQFYDIPILSVR